MRYIELLSPAKDYDTARAAVDHGADAIYMGGARFGARHAAANSLDDVARTVEYAHQYGLGLTTGIEIKESVGNVLTEEQFFDGHHIRLCHLQQLHHIVVDHFQPPGKIRVRRGGDGAAAQQLKLPPLGIHKAEAGDAVTGGDSQNPHGKLTSHVIITHLFCFSYSFFEISEESMMMFHRFPEKRLEKGMLIVYNRREYFSEVTPCLPAMPTTDSAPM